MESKVMEKIRLGWALCGSFCTFADTIREMRAMALHGFEILPIMSTAASTTDTRFGDANSIISQIEEICGNTVIRTIAQAEPIGPKKLLDILLIAPATGNTIAKIASGIADTPVTLAVKSHIRNSRPVLLAVSTNDALGQNAVNIGALMARKNFYFVPLRQDDPVGKPGSAVSDLSLLLPALEHALIGKQLQPVLLGAKGAVTV